MGTGMGIDCKRCGDQLNYDSGFNSETQLCDECYNIVKFDNPEKIKELEEEE